MDEQEKVYIRRPRYKGKYPKSFKDKYKELQPEKYGETIEHVIRKGSTPAGMHIPIMVNEILEVLDIKPGEIGLDATLGYGGHTLEMLKCLNGEGHLYALDIDPVELPKTKARLEKLGFGEKMLTTEHLNFADVDLLFDEPGQLNFVLADLGVSSMQIDNPDRGFSYKTDGPLDLRMNPKEGLSAENRLKRITQPVLEGMLIENADEPYAEEISKAITCAKKKGIRISTTKVLRDIIAETLKHLSDSEIKKSCQSLISIIY